MKILAINSCTKESEVCLVDTELNKIVTEISWQSNRDESEMLLANIDKLCKKAGIEANNIDGVLVVSGPGSFVAVRIGVVVANTLVQNLSIPLFAMNTFEFLDYATEQKFENIILEAGGKDIYVYSIKDKQHNMSKRPKDLNDFNNCFIEVEGFKNDISKKSLGEIIVNLSKSEKLDILRVEKLPLVPNYVKEPAITM